MLGIALCVLLCKTCMLILRAQVSPIVPLLQWFSTFLMLWPFSTVPYAVVTPNHKIILLLPHNCNFAVIINCNANTWYMTLEAESHYSTSSPIRSCLQKPRLSLSISMGWASRCFLLCMQIHKTSPQAFWGLFPWYWYALRYAPMWVIGHMLSEVTDSCHVALRWMKLQSTAFLHKHHIGIRVRQVKSVATGWAIVISWF